MGEPGKSVPELLREMMDQWLAETINAFHVRGFWDNPYRRSLVRVRPKGRLVRFRKVR